jgi:hypothetical protein
VVLVLDLVLREEFFLMKKDDLVWFDGKKMTKNSLYKKKCGVATNAARRISSLLFFLSLSLSLSLCLSLLSLSSLFSLFTLHSSLPLSLSHETHSNCSECIQT